jgi:Sodium/hydrogen exchanger family
VLALGGLFASYGCLLVVFVAVTAVTLLVLPRMLRLAITYLGHRVSEPEIKLLLVVLFGLGGLATQAGSEAVLPAYVAGLVVAGVFLHDRVLMDRLRSIAFALLTPFFFLRAGTLISAPALVSGAGVIALLLLVKLAAKMTGVRPAAAAFKLPRRERTYTTLLMATGLTFGSIAALFGLTHGLIDKSQYTELVTVVILSAFVPTLIAQQLFQPAVLDTEEEEALGEEDLSIIHRGDSHRPARHVIACAGVRGGGAVYLAAAVAAVPASATGERDFRRLRNTIGEAGGSAQAVRAQVRQLNPDRERVLAEDIASVIHDANRRLQIIEGDPRPSPIWDDIPESPEYQVRETVESVQAALDGRAGPLSRTTRGGWTG